jgi:hypothetical protein
MSIKEDSGNVLAILYKCKTKDNEMPNPDQLLNELGWNHERLYPAIQYLTECKFIDGDILKTQDSTKVQDVYIKDITSLGIDTVEDEHNFKINFGFAVNLGVIQFNWGKQES